jgi:hypothetical protein
VYVDDLADLDMAEAICFNAKVQRPGVCNAMETMLVHASVAARFLPRMCRRFAEAKVELRGCERTRAIWPGAKPATEEDWYAEYLDLVLAVRLDLDGVGKGWIADRTLGLLGRHPGAIVDADLISREGQTPQDLDRLRIHGHPSVLDQYLRCPSGAEPRVRHQLL